MKYLVRNEKVIRSKHEREKVLHLIEKKVHRVGEIAKNYSKPLTVEIYFKQYNKMNYLVSAVIKLKEGVVYVKEVGSDLTPTLNILFNRLRISLNRRMNKERKDYLYKRKDRRFASVHEYFSELKTLKKEDSKELFNNLLQALLTDVSRYVRRRIRSAEMTTALEKGRISIQEMLDELYLLVYARIDEVPDDSYKINTWLYQLADEVLDKQLNELEFESQHFENLAELIEKESGSMEETFTVDGENEIIPLEELDSFDEQIGMYHPGDFHIDEDENSLLDDLTFQYNKQLIHNFIEKELLKYPVYKRNIMDLYLLHQMSLEDIAEIKRMSPNEIEAVINEVSKEIKVNLALFV